MNHNERKFYRENLKEVLHTTLNPYQPGVVRIHLVPAKYRPLGHSSSVAILNGKDILPLTLPWTILLACFIQEVNKYSGKEITNQQLDQIMNSVAERMSWIYPYTPKELFEEDIDTILSTFIDIVEGKTPEAEIGYLTIGEYANKMQAPHRMDLMISSMTKDNHWNCNQKCVHCYAAGQALSEGKELTTEEWKKVIDICRKACIPQLTFTGGEPTMRKDLVELIDYAQWFVTRLNTNGALLTEELCQRLYEASLDNVQITFYSSHKEEHNQLVGASNFEKTVEGIHNAMKANLSISINTPLCRVNQNYVETLRYLHGLGVTYVTCSALIVTGNATNENSIETQLAHDELLEILKQAKQYCDENLMEINFTSPGWLSEKELRELGMQVPSCGACLSNMAIAPDGEVVPCQSWLSKEASLGNILEVEWKKIWNHPQCIKIRKEASKTLGNCPLKDQNLPVKQEKGGQQS